MPMTLERCKAYCIDCGDVEMAEALDAAIMERDAIRAFAQDIMRAWPAGDVDVCALQEAAARHGLLRETHPKQPCGEGCTCAEYYLDEDFADGSATCYRKTELLSPNA